MKKIFVFIISLVIILSMATSSLAIVDKSENIEQYIGVWYTKEDNTQRVLIIGYNNDLRYYTALYLTYGLDNKVASSFEYSITYDDELGIIYLSRAAESITFKVKMQIQQVIPPDNNGDEPDNGDNP